jgi:CRP-like cAMP-binding protein
VIWLPQRDEIGAMLGLTVETASRLVSRLRREGVLELRGARQARIDGAALQQALRLEDER